MLFANAQQAFLAEETMERLAGQRARIGNFEHGAEGGIDVQRFAIGRDVPETDVAVLGQGAEPLLALAQLLLSPAALEKDGVERDLQEALAAQPEALGEPLRLERREWPTDLGPIDLMCRDDEGGWVAVEIKRVATIDAVEQLGRYLERIRLDPARATCRGILAAEQLKPQAVTLATARGIRCVEVELALLRAEREPDLTLFSA